MPTIVDPFEDIPIDELTEVISVDGYKDFYDEFEKDAHGDFLITVERSFRYIDDKSEYKALKILKRYTDVLSQLFYRPSRIERTYAPLMRISKNNIETFSLSKETASKFVADNVFFKFYISGDMPLKAFIRALIELNFNIMKALNFLRTPAGLKVMPKELPDASISKLDSVFDFKFFIYINNRDRYIYPDFKNIDIQSEDSHQLIGFIERAIDNIEKLGLYPDMSRDDKWKNIASAVLDFIKHHRNYYSDLIKNS